jgi:hypothetical protein
MAIEKYHLTLHGQIKTAMPPLVSEMRLAIIPIFASRNGFKVTRLKQQVNENKSHSIAGTALAYRLIKPCGFRR